jgi:hypothetical protein
MKTNLRGDIMDKIIIIIPPPEVEITNWMCWESPPQAFIDTSKIISEKDCQNFVETYRDD